MPGRHRRLPAGTAPFPGTPQPNDRRKRLLRGCTGRSGRFRPAGRYLPGVQRTGLRLGHRRVGEGRGRGRRLFLRLRFRQIGEGFRQRFLFRKTVRGLRFRLNLLFRIRIIRLFRFRRETGGFRFRAGLLFFRPGQRVFPPGFRRFRAGQGGLPQHLPHQFQRLGHRRGMPVRRGIVLRRQRGRVLRWKRDAAQFL